MRKHRHLPIRTCLGCAQRAPQSALCRIGISTSGGLAMDSARRLSGRGGYLHRRESCLEQFASRKGHVRSLARTVDKSARLALVTAMRRGLSA